MGRLTTRRQIRRVETGTEPNPQGPTWADAVDVIAVEEPLELRLGGISLTVTMRTPGHDVELAHGLLYGEGVISSAQDLASARYCAGATADPTGRAATSEHQGNSYNVLDLQLRERAAADQRISQRALITSSACGICGTQAIADLLAGGLPDVHADQVRFTATALSDLPRRLRDGQPVFGRTGGVHAAALCLPDGTTLVVREDVGRHNAVDKVVGWALLNDAIPATGRVLAVSGRASYELVQKAVRAGIPALCAVSAPSSLAVDLAQASGLTLVGFAREGRFTVYTHPERIEG